MAEVGGMTLLTKKKRASSGLRLILFLIYCHNMMKLLIQDIIDDCIIKNSFSKRTVKPYEEVELSDCEI